MLLAKLISTPVAAMRTMRWPSELRISSNANRPLSCWPSTLSVAALEREVAAERLADDRHADARPSHAHVRALRQSHLNRHHADPERLLDRRRTGVELDLQRSAERDPWHVERHHPGDLTEDACRRDEDRARSIANGEEIGGAVAEGQRHA